MMTNCHSLGRIKGRVRMDRRLFLQNVAGTLVAASLPSAGLAADPAMPEKMIGIQIGAVSFC